MTVLTLTSLRNDPLEPLIASAMATELRMLEASLRQTQARLRAFEQQYGLTTAEFIARYARNEIEETLETIEWLGEYRMAMSIKDQLPTHPHHKHEGAENKVVVSPAPTLADVLSEIELQVQLN